jgi:hypothetical protein
MTRNASTCILVGMQPSNIADKPGACMSKVDVNNSNIPVCTATHDVRQFIFLDYIALIEF